MAPATQKKFTDPHLPVKEENKPTPSPKVIPRSSPRPRLHFGRLKEVDHARRHMFADIPAGTTLETVLTPDYWAHYTRDLPPMSLVEAFCEDGSWEALLRVMFQSVSEIKMSVIYSVEHDAGDDVESDLHEIKWKGPGAKWAVVHKDTGAVIQDRLYPKSEAVAFLRQHLRKLKG